MHRTAELWPASTPAGSGTAELWPAFTRPDRGTLARLKLPLGMNALLASSAAPVVPTCKRAGVPRSTQNLEMRRPARQSVSAKLGRQVDHAPSFGPEKHLCRLGSLPRGRLGNLRHDGYVKEPGCLWAPPKSSRPPGEGSGNHRLGSLLGSVMANTPGCGGGHMPINDVMYTSGALLSTSLYVLVMIDTITEEGRNRPKDGNTTRLPAGRLTSLFRPWANTCQRKEG